MSENLQIYSATIEDIPVIFELINELAIYEKMEDQVLATPELLTKELFEKKHVEVLLAKYKEKVIGQMIFFHNFSTFLGRSGIYLEDIYIKPEYRGKGFGKKLLQHLTNIALERGCGRVEWVCLDWNQPSIDFYESIGAFQLDDWSLFRLTGSAMESFGKEN